MFTGLVLLLHLLVLRALPLGVGDGFDGGVRAVLQARQIVLQPALTPKLGAAPLARARKVPALATTPTAAALAVVAELPVLPDDVGAKLVAVAPDAAASAPVSEPSAPAMSERAVEAPLPAADAVGAAPAAAAMVHGDGQRIATYATRLPPSVSLAYEMRRGGLSGEGEMVWRPRADGYNLSMQGTAFGLPVIAWASQGGFDSAGIAPERFIDRRRSRDVRAANFQRDTARITFSSPQIEYALVPGAQDRLSWMVQLPAIVQAAPESFAPGARITLFVVGARGDADLWTFVVEAVEAVDVPAGRVEGALRLLREPRKAFDTRVEVWLDPARHHLPVRLRLATAQTGDASESVLKQLTWLTP